MAGQVKSQKQDFVVQWTEAIKRVLDTARELDWLQKQAVNMNYATTLTDADLDGSLDYLTIAKLRASFIAAAAYLTGLEGFLDEFFPVVSGRI